MGKIPKLRILSILVAAAALLALLVVPVMAQPVFSAFVGSLTIDDAAAPVGSQIRAYVDGVPAVLLAPAVGNVFTLPTAGAYEIVIQTDATGKAVTFEVKMAGTDQWLAATSDPAAVVTSRQPQTVDLTASTGALVPPTVVTNAATNIGTTDTTYSATLNGNLTNMGTASSVTVSFEYGPTTAYGQVFCTNARTTTGSFTCVITGIPAGATRHFRAVADGDGAPVYGSDMSFTTGAAPPTPGETFANWLYAKFIEALIG